LDLRVDLNANPGLKDILPFNPDNEEEMGIRLPVKYTQSVITPLFMFVESDSHLEGITEQTSAFVEAANKNSKRADICVVQGNHLSALDEEISLCAKVFHKQLNEKEVVFVTLNPETNKSAFPEDTRDLVKFREEAVKNWYLSEEAKQVIQGITDENEKKAIEICNKFRKEGVLYWDDKLMKELMAKRLYDNKQSLMRMYISAYTYQTLDKAMTDKIEIKNGKDTITIYYEETQEWKDPSDGDYITKIRYTFTVDTITWRIADVEFKVRANRI